MASFSRKNMGRHLGLREKLLRPGIGLERSLLYYPKICLNIDTPMGVYTYRLMGVYHGRVVERT